MNERWHPHRLIPVLITFWTCCAGSAVHAASEPPSEEPPAPEARSPGDDARYHYELALLQRRYERLAEAEESLRQATAIALDPATALAAHRELADVYREQGRYQEAIDVLDAGAGRVGDLAVRLRRDLIRLYEEAELLPEAAEHVEQALRASGGAASAEAAARHLVFLHRRMETVDALEAAARSALAVNPDDRPALHVLVELSDQGYGGPTAGLESLTRLAELSPSDADLLRRLRDARFHGGQLEAAAASGFELLELTGDSLWGPQDASSLAEILAARGEVEAAVALLRERLAAASDPGSARLLRESWLELEERRGGLGLVVEELEAEVREGHPESLRSLVSTYRRLGDREAELATLARLAEASPEEPQLTRQLADAYAAAGRYQEAAAIHRRRLEQTPEERLFILEEIAGLYLRADDRQQARATYRELATLAPGNPFYEERLSALEEVR